MDASSLGVAAGSTKRSRLARIAVQKKLGGLRLVCRRVPWYQIGMVCPTADNNRQNNPLRNVTAREPSMKTFADPRYYALALAFVGNLWREVATLSSPSGCSVVLWLCCHSYSCPSSSCSHCSRSRCRRFPTTEASLRKGIDNAKGIDDSDNDKMAVL